MVACCTVIFFCFLGIIVKSNLLFIENFNLSALKFLIRKQGIRNAIRSRSRVGRRSGESLELHALSGSEPKLRRMPHVESDDSQHPNQDVSICWQFEPIAK